MKEYSRDYSPSCAFCGKDFKKVGRMLAGKDNFYICEDCVKECLQVLNESNITIENKCNINLIKPIEIKDFLDEYIIGQDKAKKVMAVAVYNHYKRIVLSKKSKTDIQKSNILLLGPTGSGKTYLAQMLAKIINVPLAIVDATSLTEAGYVGEDVENILFRLLQEADNDLEKAENGIIYIDEVDKISRKSEKTSTTRDVSGEGVQQALLKLIEGTVASVPINGGKKQQQESVQMNTKNILFIFGGAFDGLENVVTSRIDKNTIGFSLEGRKKVEMDKSAILKNVTPQDLVKFGLIPEFVGRIPIIVSLDLLDVESLTRILIEPKNALTLQYKELFDYDNVELEFEIDAINKIAEEAYNRKIGARGLRSIMEDILMETMYLIPSMKEKLEKCIVTKDTVENKVLPRLIYNEMKVLKNC